MGNTTTYYVWEGTQVIAEYSNAAAGAGGTSYYLADRLSTRMTTDTTGVFKGTQDHLPFGDEGGTTGTTEKHRFTNYERDAESASDYAMNRQHQYANGRFMQPDRVAGGASNPQSLNRYEYSLNDPVNAADPSGLYPSSLFGGYFLDASLSNWGLYIDGFALLAGQESLFWGLLSSGAAVVAPFGSKAYMGRGGSTWISINSGTVPNGRAGSVMLGTLDIEVRETPFLLVGFQELRNGNPSEDPYWTEITAITAAALRRLENRSECRKLLSGFYGKAYETLDLFYESHRIKSGDLPFDQGGIILGKYQSGIITLDRRFVFRNPQVAGVTSDYGLSRSEAQQLVLLHELGHATAFWRRHWTQAGSEKYNQQIVDTCFR